MPEAARACTIVVARERSAAQRMREARSRIALAAAVIDGEVVRAFAEGQPALVRAARVLKGPVQELFAVGERDSCDIRLRRVGERLRLVLVGGPDVYFSTVHSSEPRYEDRVLGSDRRRDWPYRAGEVSE